MPRSSSTISGSNVAADGQRLDAVVRGAHVVARQLQLQRQRLRRVVVVVGHEDAPRRDAPAGVGVCAGSSHRAPAACRQHRQPHGELGAAPRPVAVRRDRAPVHLGQPPDQRQADAEAALRPLGLACAPA